jgi:ribosomal protein S8E
MSYETSEFIKELNGVQAPAGFHYMPNGRLMKDADHIARYGYIQRKISGISIDLKDLSYNGETRYFEVLGDGYFSLEITDSDNKHYNFYTKTWVSSGVSGIKNGYLHKVKLEGSYSNTILFPSNTSSLKTYTLKLIAETVDNVKTIHEDIEEVRNEDNSINLNKSTGSHSNIVTKLLYQDVVRQLHLSCIAPSQYSTITSTVDGTISSADKLIFDDVMANKGILVGDLISGTGVAASTHTLVSGFDPDNDNNKEISLNRSTSISDAVTVTFTPAFNGVTPHNTESTSGRDSFDMVTGGSLDADFTLTITAPSGRLFSIKKTPTTQDLCSFKTVNIGSAGSALPEEDVSGSTFFRFPVNNIAGLQKGMSLDPSRSDDTNVPAILDDYITTETRTNFVNIDGAQVVTSQTRVKRIFNAVDPNHNDVTAIHRSGKASAQAGNLIFNVQQPDALKDNTNVKIYGHGKNHISSLNNGMEVEISNVLLTPTELTVTTTGTVSDSTTVPINNLALVTVGAEISGTNIAFAASNPTVASKAALSGAGNMTLSAAQTLENGQELKIENFTNVITLTGRIKVKNFPESDTTIFFDLERFLTSI